MRTGCGIGVVFGALAGGLSAGMLFTTGFQFKADLDSTDFLSAVLSALGALMGLVSVLLALVALAIAVAAFFGWHAIKKRTDQNARAAARNAAVPVAQKAAVDAAVPKAIEEVNEYLARLDPQIQSQVNAIVMRTLTPEIIRAIALKQPDGRHVELRQEEAYQNDFTQAAVERAARQEESRQENELDAFDAAFEADELATSVDPSEDVQGGE